jgi:hypothetical protein
VEVRSEGACPLPVGASLNQNHLGRVSAALAPYEETSDDGTRRYTVQQIANEFSVTRPTIYRHLTKPTATTPSPTP